ncbi:uncharacterized protein LOC114518695 [Dendronephthya gigantea]|uniref:uncharacterized protein LOC114518695 n=1 Tax=Dendronephthya gigantea TaxID=151771 RepID=UPI00106DCC8C|nr:uncharacterized protein LOC114518695 [Dendronephthya gigantea]
MSLFFMEFFDHLESLLLCKEALMICGDFNIHVDSIEDLEAMKFCDLFESVGLKQHVQEATHVQGHVLDLIIMRVSDYIIISQPKVDRYISGHASVVCSLATAKPIPGKRKVRYLKIKSVNRNALKQDLVASGLCTTSYGSSDNKMPEEIDALVNEYNSILTRLTEDHAPLKTKIIKARTSAPWYSAEIDLANGQRRKAERKWRKSKSLTDFNLFKTKKNYVTHLINKAQREYYTDFINQNGDSKSKLFRAVRSLFNANGEICFPNSSDNTSLSNDICSFFVSKVVRIRAEIDAMLLKLQLNNTVPDDLKFTSQGGNALTCFRELSQEEVKTLVMKSSKKYCSLDPMPMPLVMDCLDTLLPEVTYLINSSLVNGYFPKNWKEGLWNPIFKRAGLGAVFNNLRPISYLQFISKLTEQAVYEQIYDHLVLNGLFLELQSPYLTWTANM